MKSLFSNAASRFGGFLPPSLAIALALALAAYGDTGTETLPGQADTLHEQVELELGLRAADDVLRRS